MPISTINKDLCNGCGLCVDTCPEDVFRLNTQPIEKELLSPCATGCPASLSVRRYSYLVEMDETEEAYKLMREYIPFPAITGRVCPHPCESKCARCEVDSAVNINCLERYIADKYLYEKAEPQKVIYLAKAAVIGAGPAGLSCAYYLSRKGYSVTVFEKRELPGGMLRYGIPAFRLDKEVLDIEIQYLKDMGVTFKTGVAFGTDITLEELQKEYPAVFLAVGTQISRKVKTEGTNLAGVAGAFDYLTAVNAGENPDTPERAVAIGGGNVAMDAAMTLKKRGAEKVTVICLESRKEMPAFDKEIQAAVSEGIELLCGYGPARVTGSDGRVSGIDVIACTRVNDLTGKFAPLYDESISMHVDADMVCFAIGQGVDLTGMPEGLSVSASGMIQADKLTKETSLPGVFAGGDAVSASDGSVAAAFAAGKEAAESMDRYLRGADVCEGRVDATVRLMNPPKASVPKFPRTEPSDRDGVYTDNEARVEAQRCMTCGSRAEITYPQDCMVCLYCERECPQKAITVTPDRPGKRIAPWDLA
ncbi:MAG: FAD-dependent oxidoreductase [Eubacterium sp.]|nr:FAD-dependent oxidoreductase [Eubacterium sp.]